MSSKFETGDLVWAKQRYSPPWPAIVRDFPEGKNRKGSYYVFFYGTENVGWVKKKDVWPYISYIPETKKEKKNKPYMEAVKKIAQVYHEEIQLNSPTFKRMKLAEQAESDEELVQLNGEEPVQPNEEEPVQPNEEEPVQPNEEEPVQPNEEEPVQPNEEEPVQPNEEEPVQPNEEEPVQLNEEPVLEPKANGEKDFMNPKKEQRTKEEEEARQKKIQHMLKVRLFPKRGRKNKRKSINKGEKSLAIEAAEDASISQSSCISSSSSCIITVNINDYKKIITKELRVFVGGDTASFASFKKELSDEGLASFMIPGNELSDQALPSSTSNRGEQSDEVLPSMTTTGEEQSDEGLPKLTCTGKEHSVSE